MIKIFVAFLSGVVFALGLGLSGLSNPENVKLLFDISSGFDPLLLFVFAAAIGVHFIIYQVINLKMKLKPQGSISIGLVFGSILLGAGWALSGYSTETAIANLASLEVGPFVFFISMVAGMAIFRILHVVHSARRGPYFF